MKKLIPFALFLLFGTLFAVGQDSPNWLRYPAISPDGNTIVFTYKGDLYLVPRDGGIAMPLTGHEAHDYMPVWSHDGKHIAFASDRFGNFDIYVVAATGGEAKRVTFHSAPEYPYSFSRDDASIYFGSSRMDTAENRDFPPAPSRSFTKYRSEVDESSKSWALPQKRCGSVVTAAT